MHGKSPDVKPVVAKKATILGGGAFGTAMANHLGMKGTNVVMWALEKDVVADINNNHQNAAFLPGVTLSENVTATSDVSMAVAESELLLLIVPTPFIADWVGKNQSKLPSDIPIVCCSKGIGEHLAHALRGVDGRAAW